MKKIITFLKNFLTFFYTYKPANVEEISKEEYKKIFIAGKSDAKIKSTYDKAWEAKNFEIENYWKRANYFWAFQVASFAGYFAVLSSKEYEKNPQILYTVICIGFISSLAWVFINKGSKTWQRHWENHVDMLEDKVTGPLYKIITEKKTYSVSKINEIISRFFATVWFILGIEYFIKHVSFIWNGFENIDIIVILSSFAVLYFAGAMYFGYGRGRFGKRNVKFYKRKVNGQ